MVTVCIPFDATGVGDADVALVEAVLVVATFDAGSPHPTESINKSVTPIILMSSINTAEIQAGELLFI
jgi:hypothetical protein